MEIRLIQLLWKFAFQLFSFICLSSLCLAQEAGSAVNVAPSSEKRTIRDVYNVAQIDKFQVREGVGFPVERLDTLQKEVVKQLTGSKLFVEVLSEGQNPAASDSHVLHLTGVITNYKPGNRAARYFGGFGAGAVEIDSKLTFVDGATEQPILAEELRAILSGGFFGGSSEGALTDYARQVVNKTKLMVHMRLPATGTTSNRAKDAGVAESTASQPRRTVTISSKDWLGSLSKLNADASEGYRVIGVTITGKESAEVELLRADEIAEQYQYLLVHPVMSTNLQKDMRKAAAEGFRATPHSLVILGASLTAIMEKSSPPFKDHYQYVVKETMRVSSGQKDTEKLQNEGYALIGELEHGGAHLLLFEKIGPAE